MKNKFSEKIISQIKKEDIKTLPKIYFVFINILIWLFFIFSLLIWSLSLSITFSYIFNDDILFSSRIWIFYLLKTYLPIFWVIIFAVFSLFSYINFKYTSSWYKFPIFWVLVWNIFTTILLWYFFFYIWLSHNIENFFRKNVSFYSNYLVEDMESRMILAWQNPENWLLVWEILDVWEYKLKFKDYDENIWEIDISDSIIKWRVVLEIWSKIKIIWKKLPDNEFYAEEIRPYMMWSRWMMWDFDTDDAIYNWWWRWMWGDMMRWGWMMR